MFLSVVCSKLWWMLCETRHILVVVSINYYRNGQSRFLGKPCIVLLACIVVSFILFDPIAIVFVNIFSCQKSATGQLHECGVLFIHNISKLCLYDTGKMHRFCLANLQIAGLSSRQNSIFSAAVADMYNHLVR